MNKFNKMIFWIIIIAGAVFIFGSIAAAIAPFIIIGACLVWAFFWLQGLLAAESNDGTIDVTATPVIDEDDGILVKPTVVKPWSGSNGMDTLR